MLPVRICAGGGGQPSSLPRRKSPMARSPRRQVESAPDVHPRIDFDHEPELVTCPTLPRLAMGTRQDEQPALWVATADLPKAPGHPFYPRLNALLDTHGGDRFVEAECREFYAQVMGRPSLAPGGSMRLLLVGDVEGIASERGIARRATDSLAIRSFLRIARDDMPPDHSTISRTRRLIDLDTHRAVFTWVLTRVAEAGLLPGKTVAVDATTLEANGRCAVSSGATPGNARRSF